jgi:hypothetical protein
MTAPVKTRKAIQSLLNSQVDPFEINYADRPYELFTDDELQQAVGSVLVFDCECYPNYFLVAFKSVELRKVVYIEKYENSEWDFKKLYWILSNFWIVGFNSNSYDLPLITFALAYSVTCQEIKEKSNELIIGQMYPSEFYKLYKLHRPVFKHIDLIEVAPLKASLKIYGGRLHCERMQELPVVHNEHLDAKKRDAVRYYCFNDLDINIDLFLELKPQLTLRWQLTNEYQTDLLSKSDAQIAETVITTELKRKNGFLPKKVQIAPGTVYNYQVPRYLAYQTPQLQQMLEIVRNAKLIVGSDGSIALPKEIDDINLRIGSCVYKMGIGGLHSTEKCVSYKADDEHWLIDKDVASYYPAIILNLQLFPKHLGKGFLTVYRDIVNRRLAAKKAAPKGPVESSLKIVINGSFGKLGNIYSHLYSPDLLMQVTLTGQLCLLMLIELIEFAGVPVISANTDGVVSKCPKNLYNYLEAAVIHWEKITGFETEETRYKALYSRDVNNYIAIKEDNKCKVKGVYGERGSALNSVLSKNPETLICNDALMKFLADGVPIKKTILECKDIRRFVSVRNVKGGAEKNGTYLGKAVRWYYSTKAQGDINYVESGNKVAKTEGAMPLMDLPTELPTDINYAHYIAVTEEMLRDLGFYPSDNLTLF